MRKVKAIRSWSIHVIENEETRESAIIADFQFVDMLGDNSSVGVGFNSFEDFEKFTESLQKSVKTVKGKHHERFSTSSDSNKQTGTDSSD